MKLKNHYVWLLPIAIIVSILDGVTCAIDFINGTIALGCLFLFLSLAFAFCGGIFLVKAIAIYWHNQEVEWLHEVAEELKEKVKQENEPFEQFINNN